ncbi:endonuclease domain-containing protein [Planctomycetales bacterium ZRK34]|nr:endonuclease domain-containing protein [Planctomycetales bacterium ZRK34]
MGASNSDEPKAPRDRARRLRRDMTGPERALWWILRDRRLGGIKFRRQVPIGPFVVDFVCFEHRLIIEVDGESHVGRADEDARREAYLRSQGFGVVRYMNDDVLKDGEAVAVDVARRVGLDW